jgi:hypothetical protein
VGVFLNRTGSLSLVGEATINALIGVGDIESSGMIFAG